MKFEIKNRFSGAVQLTFEADSLKAGIEINKASLDGADLHGADLREAYSNLQSFDMNNFYAGETRHMLDWLWGINLSRALTSAVAGALPTASRYVSAKS